MQCKHHNPSLNAEHEPQDLDHEELAESIKRVKDSVEKLEIKTSADLTREAENLTRSINQTAETAHQELQDSVNQISQNMDEILEHIDTEVAAANSRSDNAVNAAEGRVNARVDNIITHNNDTEGNSELIDIRTGADGTVYASAGDAVRNQLSSIASALEYIEPENKLNLDTITENTIINTSGVETENDTCYTSDFIKAVKGDIVILALKKRQYILSLRRQINKSFDVRSESSVHFNIRYEHSGFHHYGAEYCFYQGFCP